MITSAPLRETTLRRDPWSWLAAAAVLALYVGVVAWLPHDTFWSPDEGAKFVQMRAVHWDGGLRSEIPYRGVSLDPDYEIYPSWCRHEDFYPHPTADGEVRFHWPIWFTLASSFFHARFGMAGLFVLPLLAGWATCLLSGLLAARFSRRLAAAAILLTGLATPVAFYSFLFWEHTLATAFGLGAVVLLADALVARSLLRTMLALLLLCAATVLRMEMLAFALAVVFACLATLLPDRALLRAWLTRSDRRLWIGVAGLIVLVTAILVATNLPPRHVWNLQRFAFRLVESVAKLPYLPGSLVQILINSNGSQGPLLPPPLAWGGLVALFAAALAPLLRAPGTQAIFTLVSLAALGQLGLLLVLLPQPYLSLHGVFAVAPFLALGGYALVAARRDGDIARRFVLLAGVSYLVAGIGLIVVLLTDLAGTYQTGLEWGARNVLTLYPLGVVASLVALAEYQRSSRPPLLKRLVLLLSVALMVESALLEVRGVRMLRASRLQVARWQQTLPTDVPIVTDTWWLPLAMAPFYTEHVMHCVLEKRQLLPWAERARRQGVERFAFASVTRFTPRAFSATGLNSEAEEETVTEGLYVRSFRLPGKRR